MRGGLYANLYSTKPCSPFPLEGKTFVIAFQTKKLAQKCFLHDKSFISLRIFPDLHCESQFEKMLIEEKTTFSFL